MRRSSYPLRIAEIAPVWLPVPPPGYGGIERVVAVLCDELVARGHDVTLFAVGGSRTRAKLVTTVEFPPHPDDPEAVLTEAVHALSAFRQAGEFDIIHDHTRLGPALAAVRSAGPPVVHTLHGPWTEQVRRYVDCVRGQVTLVAISHAQAAGNPGLGYAGVVHNGIDVGAHPYRRTKDDFLLFVGRINPEKGPAAAVEVARRAGLPLTMVIKRRERAESAYWDEVIAPLLTSDDQVFEEPPEPIKLDLLARARATLSPIDWPEPFGLVLIESMACGTPVIARSRGAALEVIEHGRTGFLCETVDEMVAAVRRLDELSPAACRARVREQFSGPSMADGYERIFARVDPVLDVLGDAAGTGRR